MAKANNFKKSTRTKPHDHLTMGRTGWKPQSSGQPIKILKKEKHV